MKHRARVKVVQHRYWPYLSGETPPRNDYGDICERWHPPEEVRVHSYSIKQSEESAPSDYLMKTSIEARLGVPNDLPIGIRDHFELDYCGRIQRFEVVEFTVGDHGLAPGRPMGITVRLVQSKRGKAKGR